jgi:hypothetical protein
LGISKEGADAEEEEEERFSWWTLTKAFLRMDEQEKKKPRLKDYVPTRLLKTAFAPQE